MSKTPDYISQEYGNISELSDELDGDLSYLNAKEKKLLLFDPEYRKSENSLVFVE